MLNVKAKIWKYRFFINFGKGTSPGKMIPQSSSQPAHQKCIASRTESLLKTAVRRMVHTKIDLLLGYEALMPKTERVSVKSRSWNYRWAGISRLCHKQNSLIWRTRAEGYEAAWKRIVTCSSHQGWLFLTIALRQTKSLRMVAMSATFLHLPCSSRCS